MERSSPVPTDSAFRWIRTDGKALLGGMQASRNYTVGMSADGQFIAGGVYDASGTAVAGRWSAFSGWIELGGLTGSCGSLSSALDINNDDASVIVGHSDDVGQRRAFRWTPARGAEFHGPGKAVAATEDGSIVLINEGSPPLLPGALPEAATIWTEEDGGVGLQQFMLDQGIVAPSGPGHRGSGRLGVLQRHEDDDHPVK